MLVKKMRVTRDAELRYLPSGEAVANVSLVYSYGTKKDERGYLPSQFIECGLWGKRAEAISQYLTKGQTIVAYVTDVHIETFNKQDGTPGYKLAGRIAELEFAGDRQQTSGEQAGDPAPMQRQAPRAPTPQRQASRPSSGFDDMNDDIPY
jgi:single-strand DNA-binding protein